MPPQYRVPGLRFWTVNLNPIDLSDNVGVRGNFYILSPTEVKTDKGGVRSDFGIHKDANAPGSLGCIVMSGDRFADFEDKMKSLRVQGIERLPLDEKLNQTVPTAVLLVKDARMVLVDDCAKFCTTQQLIDISGDSL